MYNNEVSAFFNYPRIQTIVIPRLRNQGIGFAETFKQAFIQYEMPTHGPVIPKQT